MDFAILESELQRDFEDDVQILLATLYHVNGKAKKITRLRELLETEGVK